MPVVKIESLSVDVPSKEKADEFLRGLDLIMRIYEDPRKKGAYRYSIEEHVAAPPLEIGRGGIDHW